MYITRNVRTHTHAKVNIFIAADIFIFNVTDESFVIKWKTLIFYKIIIIEPEYLFTNITNINDETMDGLNDEKSIF